MAIAATKRQEAPAGSVKLDVGFAVLAKHGEDLPGDSVEVVREGSSLIVALADGLGSGVKANILSGLTAKLSVGMLKYKCDLDEVVDCLARTLPVCEVRKIAYSTFSVLQASESGEAYLAEYDNPPAFFGKGRELLPLERSKRTVGGRTISEARFNLEPDSWVVMVSDGVIHAGLGNVWNLGWSWERVGQYLSRTVPAFATAQEAADDLAEVTRRLYQGKPGDDAAVVVIKSRQPRFLTMMVGLPKKRENDAQVVRYLMESPGKKVVCGGSTSQVVARELGRELTVNLASMKKGVPPTGFIDGIDLVAEGTLTLEKTLSYLKQGLPRSEFVYQADGASRLTSILLESDDILILLGSAINPAHQSPDLPVTLQLKPKMIEEISKILESMGKKVTIVRV